MRQIPERRTILGIALSFTLWYLVFLSDLFYSFWYRVTGASLLLMIYTKFIGGIDLERYQLSVQEAVKGIISGIALYVLFFFGFYVFRPFVAGGAINVYLFRTELPLIIPAILLLVTSYCEELFWRVYVQGNLSKKYCKIGIIISSVLYASIHLATFNLPLVFAALIAGLFWGWLYNYSDSFWTIVFSHIVWTELIFVFLPLK